MRTIVEDGDMIEIYVQCDLAICEQRDPKGLYQKARAGEIPEFTGISAPYEEPLNPEITIDSGANGVDACADQVIAYLGTHGYLNR